MALPLLPTGYVNLAGPPSFTSCTRDVYAPDTHFSPQTATRLLECVHSAITHLHAHGIVHGDIYAHNILYEPTTGNALLSDLGAAVLTRDLPMTVTEQLQAMEWRAFHTLKAEIQARIRS